MIPPSAMHRQDSSSRSPVREFNTTSTPLPPVARIRSMENSVDLDVKIRSLGIEKVSAMKVRFASVPTVTYIWPCQSTCGTYPMLLDSLTSAPM